MKNTNTKFLLVASVAALLSSNVNAAGVAVASASVPSPSLSDAVTVSFDHPQTIAVATPTNSTGTASGTLSTTAWEITSNNAVQVNFTGTTNNETNGTFEYPQFTKQEVDADGTLIDNRYDHLDTTFGIVMSGTDSIANEASRTSQDAIKTWKDGATPSATPSQLVLASTATGSPASHYGAIMPSDAGKFTMTLYSKGEGNADSTQSGIYSTTLTAVITADEKGTVE